MIWFIAFLNFLYIISMQTRNYANTVTTASPERKVWGSASIRMRRLLNAEANRFSLEPRYTSLLATTLEDCPTLDDELPNARLVSHIFHSDGDAEDNLATHMVVQMGQFVDHDITLTPEEHEDTCCDPEPTDSHCFRIAIPSSDSFYAQFQQDCLRFARSTAYCEPESRNLNTSREQINAITAFVDASNVYSSIDGDNGDQNQQEGWDLRTRDGTGKLKVGDNDLLPKLINDEETAGDVRAREMPGLAAMHTLFVREHNRLCGLLANDTRTNGWGDEAYYQNARRILIAEMQNVIYGEYLPVVLGSKAMEDNGLVLPLNINSISNSQYDVNEDPSITNSFATAAYRFGHSMIQGIIQMRDTIRTDVVQSYPLSENYFNMTNYELDNGNGMEQVLMGLLMQKAQKNDRLITTETTNKLFPHEGEPFGADLAARNIQRGRDHGLPGYVTFWRSFGRQPNDPIDINCWSDKPTRISQANWNILRTLYRHPKQIDLFVGGLAEDPDPTGGAAFSGLTGPTFNKIKALQFKSLKSGDRYFFTHVGQAGSFTNTGVDTLLSRKLSDIICDNTEITKLPTNSFNVPGANNEFKFCTDATHLNIAAINLFPVQDPVNLLQP